MSEYCRTRAINRDNCGQSALRESFVDTVEPEILIENCGLGSIRESFVNTVEPEIN